MAGNLDWGLTIICAALGVIGYLLHLIERHLAEIKQNLAAHDHA